jgi:hypothetical protein
MLVVYKDEERLLLAVKTPEDERLSALHTLGDFTRPTASWIVEEFQAWGSVQRATS